MPPPTPPVARRKPKTEWIHGHERVDDYFWLREKDSPEVLAYLQEEAAYADAVMAPTQPLQETLYKDMLGRIKETDASVPSRKGDWLYYTRTEEGKPYPISCRRRAAPEGSEQILLDLNEIGKSQAYVGLGVHEVSDDGNLLAFALDTTGYRQYVLGIKDLRTGEMLPDRIPLVTSVAFTKDPRTLLYVVEDSVSKRSHRLFRHVLGTPPAGDPLVYEERDEMFDIEVERSRSQELILLTAASKTTSEVRYLRAEAPAEPLAVLAPREHQHEYYVDHRGDAFYVRTNAGGRNFRLCRAPVADQCPAGWREIVPHRENVMLESIQVFENHAVLIEREDGLRRIRVADGAFETFAQIAFPDPAYEILGEPNPEFGSGVYRFNYQSPITPPSVYEYEVGTRELRLLKRTEILGGYDPARYEVRRLHANAEDGTRIPLTLISRKGAAPDQRNAALLYGYGAYGYPLPDLFSSNRISLLDRGLTLALAHVRGGGELGKRWHDEGRMLSKPNTFTDFIAAAELLVQEGWASKDGLVIEGGSAGGLLVGAVVTMRPELFRVVLSHVPFVDVINTMLDETLPLTVGEFEEWGNPKVREQYDCMMRYSPYDNLVRGAYPAMLVMTSYNDSQVMYWEPAKYVAKLRALKTDTNPLLLRINMEPAGHGGQSGRYNQLREVAFGYAFILTQLGLG